MCNVYALNVNTCIHYKTIYYMCNVYALNVNTRIHYKTIYYMCNGVCIKWYILIAFTIRLYTICVCIILGEYYASSNASWHYANLGVFPSVPKLSSDDTLVECLQITLKTDKYTIGKIIIAIFTFIFGSINEVLFTLEIQIK